MDRQDAQVGVLFEVAPRDYIKGDGVGRKTGSEAREAVRRGHLFAVTKPVSG